MPSPSSVTRSSTPSVDESRMPTLLACAWRATFESASRSTASRSGTTSGSDAGVDRPVEVDVRLEARPIGDLVHELEHLDAEARVLVGLEGEDAGADLADRLVDLVDGLHEASPIGVAGRVRCDRLQHHPHGEEPLDDRVVQVAGDPLPVLEAIQQVPVVAAAGELDGERGLVGERLDDRISGAANDGLPLCRLTRSTPRHASCPVSGR